MTRPRWHDVLITAAIAIVVAYGAWALWWADVRGETPDDGGSGSAVAVQPQT
jgi:hypothetical protein|nr:hypothetical protein [Kofleriaceae bacterium]